MLWTFARLLKCFSSRAISSRKLHDIRVQTGAGVILDYKGTVGICRKTIIINLLENLKALKHCLMILKFFVVIIICVLEKLYFNDVESKDYYAMKQSLFVD